MQSRTREARSASVMAPPVSASRKRHPAAARAVALTAWGGRSAQAMVISFLLPSFTRESTSSPQGTPPWPARGRCSTLGQPRKRQRSCGHRPGVCTPRRLCTQLGGGLAIVATMLWSCCSNVRLSQGTLRRGRGQAFARSPCVCPGRQVSAVARRDCTTALDTHVMIITRWSEVIWPLGNLALFASRIDGIEGSYHDGETV